MRQRSAFFVFFFFLHLGQLEMFSTLAATLSYSNNGPAAVSRDLDLQDDAGGDDDAPADEDDR